MINTIAAIATGGALGAVLRYAMHMGLTKLIAQPFPYGTLAVNVIGSFAMGALVTFFMTTGQISNEVKMFFTVGVLGSFTTFSTFSLDAMTLWTRGDLIGAGIYVLGSLTLSIAALALGTYLIWRITA
ncbi:MAG: fluoride efflux transporter CrcB [Alphaproteobacteria bacterium]